MNFYMVSRAIKKGRSITITSVDITWGCMQVFVLFALQVYLEGDHPIQPPITKHDASNLQSCPSAVCLPNLPAWHYRRSAAICI